MEGARPAGSAVEGSRTPRRRLAATAAVVIVGLGVVLVTHRSARSPSRAHPCGRTTSAALAWVAPLQPGGALDGWRIACVGEGDGAVRLLLVRGAGSVELAVHRADPDAPEPAARGDGYAVYYASHEAEDAAAVRLAAGLARSLDAHGPHVPPATLAPFAPQPRPTGEE